MNGIQETNVNAISGISTGNFDNVNSSTFEEIIPAQSILYLSGLTGNVQDQIDNIYINSGNTTAITDLQTILTGASWDSVYNFLNLTNNLHVFGTLTVGDPQINVGYTLSNLSTTYATISDLQTNYVTYNNLTIEFTNRLVNYVLYSGLNTTLNNYVTNSFLTSQLNNYVTLSGLIPYALSSQLNNYVTLSGLIPYALSSQLNNYVTLSGLIPYALTSQLNNYVTLSGLTISLNSYALTSSLSSYALTSSLVNYETTSDLSLNWVSKTYLTNQLNSYVTNTSLTNTLNSYVTNSSLSNTLNGYCTKSAYDSLKTQADASTTWITANGVTLLGLIATTAGLTGSVATIQGQITTINGTLGNHEERLTTLQNKTTNISYNIGTNITTVGGAQLNANAINAGSFLTGGNITTTGGVISAYSDITSTNGIISSTTMNTNNINLYSGTSLNIGNSATTINMGSSTLGNTINIGNLLSTIYLNGDVHISSNNPFDFFNQTIRQF
jgi:hypothetical protein